jgi:hypothetical protein
VVGRVSTVVCDWEQQRTILVIPGQVAEDPLMLAGGSPADVGPIVSESREVIRLHHWNFDPWDS